MADDDFIEDFNITESDLDSAFNPTRRRGRQSKEEALYGKKRCCSLSNFEISVNFAGIWATASARATTRPTTTTTSYSRVAQPIAFVSGGVKLGSKIDNKKPATTKPTKKSIISNDYISDEDSDELADDDENDDDDEVEVIGKKRKKRGDMSDDDDDDDSHNEDEAAGSVRYLFL